ncbi:oxidoreductase [Rhizobium sp. P32RR-XVIII]|uniref:oxidoreductase n=1 Tax=Rhizobium sp. P32RR-XVIII TaxID=2726738 RepID=UPI0014570F42|nr:oxidoreductase [Rhizobium sp. P32RR-XVIII]NLS03816.1 oxidoreductase [Rhizobium sp. P32RR-XVIII]
MLLKLITVSALSIGLATSAMAQASGGSGGTGGSGSTSGSGATGGSGGAQNQNTSGNFNGGSDAAGSDIRESSDCVQGKTAANKAGKPVAGTAKDAGGNCQ